MAAKMMIRNASSLLRRCSAKSFEKGHAAVLTTRWKSSAASEGTFREVQDPAEREHANYEARVELATAYRAVDLYQLGEGICNHLTMRAPGRNTNGDVMLVVPYGLPWKHVTASSLIGVDFVTGKKVEGGEGEALNTAVNIHCPIHQVRHKIDGTVAVLHTHQPYTTALACLDEPEPFDATMCQNSMRFAGKIAFDFEYQTIADEMGEGLRLANALGGKEVLLMGQHGVLTVGRRVCDALDALYYLERASMTQILVRSTGAKSRSAPPSVVSQVSGYYRIPESAKSLMDSIKKLIADDKPNYLD